MFVFIVRGDSQRNPKIKITRQRCGYSYWFSVDYLGGADDYLGGAADYLGDAAAYLAVSHRILVVPLLLWPVPLHVCGTMRLKFSSV